MPKSKAFILLSNSIFNFSGYGIAIALGLISYPIIIHTIGLDAVGIYALIMAVLAPMDLTNLGFAEATIKYVAQYEAKGDVEKVKQYISTTLSMSLIVGLLGMIIIFFAGPPVAYALFDFKSESYETIQLCFGMVAIGWLIRQLTAVFLSIPSALQKYKVVALGNSISSILTTGSILLVLLYEKNIVGYALGSLIGAGLSLLFWYAINVFNFSTLKYSVRFYKEVWLTSFHYGIWQTLGSIGSLITNQTDKYFVGVYLPASSSGVYNVILQIQQRILSAIWKVAEVMFPMFSASSEKDLPTKFSGLTRSNYMLTAIGVIVFFPFIVLAYPTLDLWIGREFADQGHIVMQCLLLIGVFASTTVVQTFFLMGNAKVRQTTLVSYFTGFFTIVGSLLFIPAYGLNGAGYGILFAAVTRLLLFYFIMNRFFTNSFVWQEYLVATLLPLASGACTFLLFHNFPIIQPSGFVSLVLGYMAIALVVIGFIFFSNILIPGAGKHNYEILALGKEIKDMILNNGLRKVS